MAAKKSTTKKSKAKKSRSRKKPAAVDLSAYDARIPPDAETLNPDIPVDEGTLDAERRLKEAKRHEKALAKLPSFDLDTLVALALAIVELETAQEAWVKSRRKERGATLEAVAKKARAYVEEVVRKSRYIFRHDPALLARVEEISLGDGVADLGADLNALAPITKNAAEAFDAFKSTKGAAAKLATFSEQLASGSDSVTALQAQAVRNRAFWRMSWLSREVYDALIVVLQDEGVDIDRVVNLRSFETRKRAANRRKQAEKKRLAGQG